MEPTGRQEKLQGGLVSEGETGCPSPFPRVETSISKYLNTVFFFLKKDLIWGTCCKPFPLSIAKAVGSGYPPTPAPPSPALPQEELCLSEQLALHTHPNVTHRAIAGRQPPSVMNLHHCVSGWQLLTHPIEIAVSERMPAGWGCHLLTQVGIVSGCVEDVWLCRWPWLRLWLPRVAAFLLNPGSSKLSSPLGHHPEQQRPAEKSVSGIFCYTEEMGSFRVTNSWEGGRQSGEPRREMGPTGESCPQQEELPQGSPLPGPCRPHLHRVESWGPSICEPWPLGIHLNDYPKDQGGGAPAPSWPTVGLTHVAQLGECLWKAPEQAWSLGTLYPSQVLPAPPLPTNPKEWGL